MVKKRMFCMVGTDGVGKSTVIDLLVKDIEKQQIPYIVKHVGDFIIHNEISRLFSRKKINKPRTFDFKTGKSKKNKGITFSLISIIILSIEFAIMYFLTEILFNKKRILIMDRSPYDLYVLNNKKRFKLLETFFVRYLFPKPLMVFVLNDDYERIYKRKPQRSLSEMKHYYTNIFDILKHNRINNKTINVEKGPRYVSKQVYNHIKKFNILK